MTLDSTHSDVNRRVSVGVLWRMLGDTRLGYLSMCDDDTYPTARLLAHIRTAPCQLGLSHCTDT